MMNKAEREQSITGAVELLQEVAKNMKSAKYSIECAMTMVYLTQTIDRLVDIIADDIDHAKKCPFCEDLT
jgi:hypothetical protein